MMAAVHPSSQRLAPCILIVEDEMLLRLDVANQLRLAGFDAIEVHNADEAVSIFTRDIHIDAVVTDIRMPGTMDGVELIEWLNRRDPQIKIIVVSAFVGDWPQLPVNVALPKPVRIKKLLESLRQVLAAPPRDGVRVRR